MWREGGGGYREERVSIWVSLTPAQTVQLSHADIQETSCKHTISLSHDGRFIIPPLFPSTVPEGGGGGGATVGHCNPTVLRADFSSQIFRRALCESLNEINRWGLGSIFSTGRLRGAGPPLIGEVAEVYIKECGD